MPESKYDLNFASLSRTCFGSGLTVEDPNTFPSMCALLQGTLSGASDQGYFYAHVNITGTNHRYAVTRNITIKGTPTNYRSFVLADGAFVAFNNSITSCTLDIGGDITALDEKGFGFIDVNGGTLPNKEVACSDGRASISSSVGNCIVRNNANDMGDIFPVVFHDSTVEPLTDAARYVLQQTK